MIPFGCFDYHATRTQNRGSFLANRIQTMVMRSKLHSVTSAINATRNDEPPHDILSSFLLYLQHGNIFGIVPNYVLQLYSSASNDDRSVLLLARHVAAWMSNISVRAICPSRQSSNIQLTMKAIMARSS